MGMGECIHQKDCELFSEEARGCEHLYFNTYEDWCSHEIVDIMTNNFPTKDQRKSADLIGAVTKNSKDVSKHQQR